MNFNIKKYYFLFCSVAVLISLPSKVGAQSAPPESTPLNTPGGFITQLQTTAVACGVPTSELQGVPSGFTISTQITDNNNSDGSLVGSYIPMTIAKANNQGVIELPDEHYSTNLRNSTTHAETSFIISGVSGSNSPLLAGPECSNTGSILTSVTITCDRTFIAGAPSFETVPATVVGGTVTIKDPEGGVNCRHTLNFESNASGPGFGAPLAVDIQPKIRTINVGGIANFTVFFPYNTARGFFNMRDGADVETCPVPLAEGLCDFDPRDVFDPPNSSTRQDVDGVERLNIGPVNSIGTHKIRVNFVRTNGAFFPSINTTPPCAGCGEYGFDFATIVVEDPTAPTVELKVNGTDGMTIFRNDPIIISWQTTNSPTSCTATGNWSGARTSASGPTYTDDQSSDSAVAGVKIYNIACTKGAVTVNDSVSVSVMNVPPPCVNYQQYGNNQFLGCAYEWDDAGAAATVPAPTPFSVPTNYESIYWVLKTVAPTSPSTPYSGTVPALASPINFNWGVGAPAGISKGDRFMVIWRGRFNFAAGNYTFNLGSGSGAALYLNDQKIVDRWNDGGVYGRTPSAAQSLSGLNELMLMYYETAGNAQVDLSWSVPATADIKANGSDGPINIPYNTAANLSWTYFNATSCVITSPGSPSIYPNGNGSVSTGNLVVGRPYSISCDPGNVTDSVQVNVDPPTEGNLNVIKSGQGRVTSAPVGINCGSDCSHTYPRNITVRLTETHSPGRVFTGWLGGGCSGRTSYCDVIIDADNKTVTANFAVDPNYKEF